MESLIDLFAAHAERIAKRHGEILFLAGDFPRDLFRIGVGRVRLEWARRPLRKEIATEPALLALPNVISGQPHDATAIAVEPCVVYRLDRETLLKQFRSDPTASFRLVEALSADVAGSYDRLRASLAAVRRR